MIYSEKWVGFMWLTKDLECYTLYKSFHFLSLSSFRHYKVLGPIYSPPDPNYPPSQPHVFPIHFLLFLIHTLTLKSVPYEMGSHNG